MQKMPLTYVIFSSQQSSYYLKTKAEIQYKELKLFLQD